MSTKVTKVNHRNKAYLVCSRACVAQRFVPLAGQRYMHRHCLVPSSTVFVSNMYWWPAPLCSQKYHLVQLAIGYRQHLREQQHQFRHQQKSPTPATSKPLSSASLSPSAQLAGGFHFTECCCCLKLFIDVLSVGFCNCSVLSDPVNDRRVIMSYISLDKICFAQTS